MLPTHLIASIYEEGEYIIHLHPSASTAQGYIPFFYKERFRGIRKDSHLTNASYGHFRRVFFSFSDMSVLKRYRPSRDDNPAHPHEIQVFLIAQ